MSNAELLARIGFVLGPAVTAVRDKESLRYGIGNVWTFLQDVFEVRADLFVCLFSAPIGLAAGFGLGVVLDRALARIGKGK